MEPDDLKLPQRPNDGHAWTCNSKRLRVVESLQTGVNPNKDVSEDNLPRTMTRYLMPYMDNLKFVADNLLLRAKQAEMNFLSTAIDLQFDRVGLKQTINDIRDYHEDVVKYRQLADSMGSQSDYNQVVYLHDHVMLPVFTGNGFEVIGDENSEWVHFIPVYCEHIRLGKLLNDQIGHHVNKWQEMGYTGTTEESGVPTSPGRSVSGRMLGLLGLVAVGAWLTR